ncbi:MAG: Gfo/Idh/MocA family oxidoreductase [Opitutales bacterium]|nr:Gfo/Idh/MocA family oxidoreductase [Opitutales bacterium]
MDKLRDGMNWAPKAETPKPVVKKGEFIFASAFFEHGHIFGQTEGLLEAGGVCKWAWDPDPKKLADFCAKYEGVKAAESYEQILEDPEVHLVTAAAVPCDRAEIGFQTLRAGKDYFTDKSPFTTLEQLEEAKKVVAETNRKYMCDFSERLHNEASYHAGELVRQGAVGEVVQIINLAPHNLARDGRPEWFFDKEKYGGILTDIGSHQFEQFLYFADAKDGVVNFARVDNFFNKDKPGLEDFGEASLTLDNGVSCYCRLDWMNPAGLRSWGDGRTIVLGKTGTLEIRKNIDICTDPLETQVIYLIDGEGEKRIPCTGKVGFPFYGQLVLDVLNRTDKAMTQDHCFKSAELSLLAQKFADEQNAKR